MDSYPERMTVGEVVDDPPLPRQKEYVAGTDRLHTAYGFHLLQARRATAALFADALSSWDETDGWPSWSLGNHDVARFATRLAGGDPLSDAYADGGVDGDARDGVSLSGRGARSAPGAGAVRSAAGSL